MGNETNESENIRIAKASIVMVICHVSEDATPLNPFDTINDVGMGTGFFTKQISPILHTPRS